MSHLPKNFFVVFVAEEGNAGMLVAPHAVLDGERHQHPGGYHWIDLAELACLDAAPNDSTEQVESTGDDFVSVEPSEIGELVQLTEDEPIDGAEDRRAYELPIAAHYGAELLGGSALGDRFLARFDGRHGSLPDHLAEKVFLVGEIQVDGAFGDAGPFGDILEAGLGETALAKNLESGLNDLLGPVLRASTPFWLG